MCTYRRISCTKKDKGLTIFFLLNNFYPNVKYSPFFQSNANQPMPLNADWLRIGRKCQCLTNPFEMDRIGNFGLEPQKKPIQNQSLIIKPMLRNPAANSLPI